MQNPKLNQTVKAKNYEIRQRIHTMEEKNYIKKYNYHAGILLYGKSINSTAA